MQGPEPRLRRVRLSLQSLLSARLAVKSIHGKEAGMAKIFIVAPDAPMRGSAARAGHTLGSGGIRLRAR
jgi:hypothetical protein